MKPLINIQKRPACNQATFTSKEGETVKKGALQYVIDEIIHDNATYKDGYSLFVCDLPKQDKKLLLSYLVPFDDYQDFIKNPIREECAFVEYEKEMQFLIDQRIDDLWHEDMKEASLTLCRHNDNGEFYYVK